jgi:hypothetical protein
MCLAVASHREKVAVTVGPTISFLGPALTLPLIAVATTLQVGRRLFTGGGPHHRAATRRRHHGNRHENGQPDTTKRAALHTILCADRRFGRLRSESIKAQHIRRWKETVTNLSCLEPVGCCIVLAIISRRNGSCLHKMF